MAIRFGNAASPRWFDLSTARLDQFIAALAQWGASSTELVLDAGAADEATARVHILEEDWDDVSRRFQDRGFLVHAHAPLAPCFKLDRWHAERMALQDAFRPVLAACARFGERQDRACVLVLHAASSEPSRSRDATVHFAAWAFEQLESANVLLAFELRKPRGVGDAGFDRSRDRLAAFVAELGDNRIGVCWDIAHDWEGGRVDPAWRPEPEASFLRHVVHVHLHGSGTFEGREDVHFPLQHGEVPWRRMLSPLVAAGYDGSMTIEARYRYARAVGEPWSVLAASFLQLRSWLDSQTSSSTAGSTDGRT